MRPSLPLRSTVALACLVSLWPTSAVAAAGTEDDWPQFRGPERRGEAATRQVFPEAGFGLEVIWKRPLGSGYSSVSVAGQRAVTMFAEGGKDVVAAFDVDSGSELWRHQIADTYAGHSGSDDGPISTPLVVEGTVYGLGPFGDLFAVDLESGAARWQRRLGESESKAPHYGFTTVPVVAGELLILETGGAGGHAITAVDRATGTTRWSHGDDAVAYQSPILVELAGRQQLVAVTNNLLLGLDPATGSELWRHEHGLGDEAGEGFAIPIPVGAGGLMINGWDAAAVFDVAAAADGFSVAERWRSDVLKSSYALPVIHDGHAYGMSRRFLTCVDLADGKLVWRSRPPGGLGVSLVDGHLAIVGQGGELVVAAATPAGYQEAARVAVFDGDPYTAPSFAAGRFFVRDLESLAAVRVSQRPAAAVAVADADPGRYLGTFGMFVSQVAGMPAAERQAHVDAYFSRRSAGPITEQAGDAGFAHVVHRGEHQDVAMRGNLPGLDQEQPLHRLAGTDLFFRSFELDPAGQWQYQMTIDFSDPVADPGNPRRMAAGGDEHSVLAMPEARATPHLDGPPANAARGRIEPLALGSEETGDAREVAVYLPAGYDAGTDRYPLLVVNNGQLREGLRFEDSLDYLIAAGDIEPVIVAFVPRASPLEYAEQADAYVSLLLEQLLPRLEAAYRIAEGADRHALTGLGSGARISVYTALRARDRFAKVATQSFYVRGLERVLEVADAKGLYAYLEVRSQPYTAGGVDAGADTQQLAAALRSAGAEVEIGEVIGGADFAGWRTSQDQVLIALFGRKR